MTQDVTRNVALWISNSGPMMFDGSLMTPIPGIENYFDKTKPECINWSMSHKAWSRINQANLIWHVAFPSGVGQQEVNVHLGYDLKNRERGWFEHDHAGGNNVPRCGFEVLDTDGVNYLYGGVDRGAMIRMEHGSSWAGESIIYTIETGDVWLSDSIWIKSILRAFKIIAKRCDTQLTADIYGLLDTKQFTISDFQVLQGYDMEVLDGYDFDILTITNEGYKTFSMEIPVSGTDRLYMSTKRKVSWTASTHRLRFVIDNEAQDSVLTLIGYGLAFELGREDLVEA